MAVTDKRIDEYIAKAEPFAKPILNHLRKLIHNNCKDVVETMKWSFPHFIYKEKTLFSMASFKQHCACGFRLASLMKDPQGLLQTDDKTAMGSLGRITAIKDLPEDKILAQYIKESVQLTDQGAKPPKAVTNTASTATTVPDYFMAALKKNKKALATFEQFPPSHRKEYIEWITEAKREETRDKRMATALEWLAEGKARHWKYGK
jgi:uncharacterized protein YdeI (YjbR/CyaY-like superfamily)